MDRLDMVLELVQEAKTEREALAKYEREYNEALEKDLKTGGYKERSKVWEKYTPTPKKSHVNDNLKMARRIPAGEYM